ncbi:riboflavin synthase [Arenicella xantha]|uniref:Riboflavin synthase n=1 Tax=Arenicella xantha TaxID=644221 RepID=A0A395JJ27_9GAMM|nr:riboflavin synthase [Arenicella xantha]RBP50786.1 riboflavin synthase alpha chain [Arenicella xantha]
MFTGLVETIGTVSAKRAVGGDVRISIRAADYQDRTVALGDSIAVNGVCLTVIELNGDEFSFDVSLESINHSLIGQWQVGTRVNLEMALLPTTRLGGHLVSGHVDGLAELIGLTGDARSWRMDFKVPDDLKRYIAKKGSITINGTSLTVNAVNDNCFDVNVIPHTFEVTTLGDLSIGDKVHIEVDLIARYLERLLTGEKSSTSSISQSFLAEHGFT